VLCYQAQWQQLQDLMLYTCQCKQSVLLLTAPPFCAEGWSGIEMSQQLQSLWPLLLTQQQLSADPLQLAPSLNDWQLSVCPMALRQCLSLMLSAGLDWREPGSRLCLQRQVMSPAIALELQFDIAAKWQTELAQWPQQADDWRLLLQGMALPAPVAAEDFCWLLWSCQFWAERMDASFSLHCSHPASSTDSQRLLCKMQLRFQS
jgi:hypothetical protein